MEPPSLQTDYPLPSFEFWTIVVLSFILFLSAVFSGSETALVSLSAENKLNESNKKSIQRISKLLKNPGLLGISITIANSLFNISFILLCNYLFIAFSYFGGYWILQLSVIVLLLLFFGEVFPKFIAGTYPLAFLSGSSFILKLFFILLKPFSIPLYRGIRLLGKRFSIKKERVSFNDLVKAIDQDGGKSSEDRKMLKAIVYSSSVEVREIICPRIDVTAISFEANFSEVQKIVVDSAYSRIPVYNNNFDDIKGILYVKDLLPYINEKSDFNWQQLVRNPHFVPESKKINDLLDEFQRKKIHMAIVVDEYGGTAGIVTLEDILEEIVGDILDESDEESDENFYNKMKDGTYSFEGKTLLRDFYRIFHERSDLFEEEQGEADTLAGLLLEHKGEFPIQGEIIKIKNYIFVIEEIDERRIIKVKVRKDE